MLLQVVTNDDDFQTTSLPRIDVLEMLSEKDPYNTHLHAALAGIIHGARFQRAVRLNSRTLANRTASLPKRGVLWGLVATFNHRMSCDESSRSHE